MTMKFCELRILNLLLILMKDDDYGDTDEYDENEILDTDNNEY